MLPAALNAPSHARKQLSAARYQPVFSAHKRFRYVICAARRFVRVPSPPVYFLPPPLIDGGESYPPHFC